MVKKLLSWQKIESYSRKAGWEVLAVAEASYKTLTDPTIPWHHRSLIMGALVYLLSPIDMIPDFLPGGFSDDITVLLVALYKVGSAGKDHLKVCREKHGLSKESANDVKGEEPHA